MCDRKLEYDNSFACESIRRGLKEWLLDAAVSIDTLHSAFDTLPMKHLALHKDSVTCVGCYEEQELNSLAKQL